MIKNFVSIVSNRTLVAAAMLGIVVVGCTRDPVRSTAAPSAVAPASPGANEQSKAAVYKCPMHSNVTSDRPGKCPECGMNLEKVQ